MCGTGEAKGLRLLPHSHAVSTRALASEGEAYPQAHRAPVIDTVLIEAGPDAPEVSIAFKNRDWQ